MTDALVNDKPQFVRLFCENGLNILDYLTYQRLESLYRSLSDSSLAYTLLQRHLSERQGVAGSLPQLERNGSIPLSPHSLLTGAASLMELSMFEVRGGGEEMGGGTDSLILLCHRSCNNNCIICVFIF